ncbi:MAG: hypothetical protein ACREMX_04545 [Gemmatimonadales bacterium]
MSATVNTWLLLILAQLGILAMVALVGPRVEARWTAGGQAIPRNSQLLFGGLGLLAFVGFVICIPALLLRVFISAQARIGNGGYPAVEYLSRHEPLVLQVVLAGWLLGVIIALPLMVQDLRHRP